MTETSPPTVDKGLGVCDTDIGSNHVKHGFYRAPSIEDSVKHILQYIGEDTERSGLKETPQRVIASWSELFSGYKKHPKDVFKTFDGEGYDEMIILRNVEFYSTCEHHMIPFVGSATIAYIPASKGKIIGLSKLARLLEIFARRLQVQERLTNQVTQALDEYLQPLGSACVIDAKHFCVCSRGVQKQHSSMTTSSLTGVFRKTEVRMEFLTLAGLK